MELRRRRLRGSMGQVASAGDNAALESLFSLLAQARAQFYILRGALLPQSRHVAWPSKLSRHAAV